MHFNNRLPPSRRLEKYQPESYITTKKSRGNKPVTAPRRPSQIHGNEELLAHSELQDAEVRAEVSEDLSLGTINSRSDRRGSEATVVSLPAETPEKQLVKRPLGESDPAIISKWGKEKGKKIAEDQYAVEAGILYDMSLERALFKTVKKPWWICFWLIFIDCESRPLVNHHRGTEDARRVATRYTSGLSTAYPSNQSRSRLACSIGWSIDNCRPRATETTVPCGGFSFSDTNHGPRWGQFVHSLDRSRQ